VVGGVECWRGVAHTSTHSDVQRVRVSEKEGGTEAEGQWGRGLYWQESQSSISLHSPHVFVLALVQSSGPPQIVAASAGPAFCGDFAFLAAAAFLAGFAFLQGGMTRFCENLVIHGVIHALKDNSNL